MIVMLTLVASALAADAKPMKKNPAESALTPAPTAELFELTGQGVPRQTETDCTAAGKALGEKLKKKFFQAIVTRCAHTSDEAGEFVPVVSARHTGRFTLEQGIGSRRGDLEACKKDLKQLENGSTAGETVLETECVVATEYRASGDGPRFYQAWMTRLVPAKK